MSQRNRKLKNSHIKNIIFDFDETLLHTRPHITEFIHDYFNIRGITFSEEQEIAAGKWSHKFWNDVDIFSKNSEEQNETSLSFWLRYVEKYYELLGLNGDNNRELFLNLALAIDSRVIEKYLRNDTMQTLAQLKSNGYRMGILSNRETTLSSILEDNKLVEYFESSLTAGELGVAKPDPKIFTEFFEYFNGTPEESIYVGDNYWLDIVCAEQAGLRPVIFDYFQWYKDMPYPIISTLSQLIDLLEN